MWNWLRVVCEHVGIDYDGYKRRIKNFPKKKRLSFISIHYLYIIGMTIAFSIIIYGKGHIEYIDALFFASGSATQSGLNTVDVNDLELYQQIAIYLEPLFCTPIFINLVVVWVRLYWFERRFQDIAQEARLSRQSRTRSFSRTFSRSRSMGQESADPERGQNGVRGRNITVVRSSLQPVEEAEGFEEKRAMSTVPESSSSGSTETDKAVTSAIEDDGPNDETVHSPRAIHFPDEAKNPDRHIALLQRQRDESNTKPLRIPGPREAEGGAVPEEVEGRPDDDETERPHGILKNRAESNTLSIRPNVTIEEPQRPLHNATTEGRGHRRLPSNPYALRTPTAPNDTDAVSTLKRRRTSMSSLRPTTSAEAEQATVSYLSWQPTIGRNSLFIDLTDEQRDELGGIEYRALKTLSVFLSIYYVGFHLLGVVILVPWILRTQEYGQVVDASSQNRVWWGIFSAATFFNDLGFTLTPDSFISFQLSALVMLLGSFLIVIGNTGFPCMLRFLIWGASKLCPKDGPLYEELRFLLDHPRRCFTLLFPAAANWVLFGILVTLNGIDLIFFVILDINDPTVTDLPPAFRFLDGLFQAFSTRTAGTACVNVADLHPGIQVSYLIMMYISVFPLAISVRRTNVYEERSLGVYSTADEGAETEPSYVGAHLRKQLSFDLWFVFLGLFIIAIAEGQRIADTNQPAFEIFPCLFEIVSAYGTVGLSLGYPGINASFSAEFTVVSKLVIIAMQIRGRHRGLPYELDRAILLPGDHLHRKEQEESDRQVFRRASTLNLEESSNGQPLFRTPTYRTTRDTNRDTNQDMNQEENAQSTGREVDFGSLRSRTLEPFKERPRAGRGVGEVVHAAANPITTGKKVANLLGNLIKIGPSR